MVAYGEVGGYEDYTSMAVETEDEARALAERVDREGPEAIYQHWYEKTMATLKTRGCRE